MVSFPTKVLQDSHEPLEGIHVVKIHQRFLAMVPSSDVEMKEHTKNYAEWLKNFLAQGSIDDIATWLAQKPSPTVLTYQAYDINGYTFYTEERHQKTSYQNNSVPIECMTVNEADKRVYYGPSKRFGSLTM